MPSLLKDLNRDIPTPVFNGLLYGSGGSGKTELICSAIESEELSPVLIITCESMDPTLLKYQKLGVEVFDIPTYMRENNIRATSVMKKLVKEIKDGNLPFRTIGFDGGSKLVNPIIYREVLQESKRSAESKNRSHDEEIMEQSDYLRCTSRVFDWIESIRISCIKHRINFILTAREKIEDLVTPSYEGDFYYPDFNPELRRLVLHEFDFCYHMMAGTKLFDKSSTNKTKISKKVWYLYTSPMSDRVIKSKLDGLQPKVINAKLMDIYKCVNSNCKVTEIEVEEEIGEEL